MGGLSCVGRFPCFGCISNLAAGIIFVFPVNWVVRLDLSPSSSYLTCKLETCKLDRKFLSNLIFDTMCGIELKVAP
jgi:hypothetical protein